ncbi:hypothetical protein Slin15195_G062090 [Septoria linicola]|uniref:F-box domain-containing protein n=1 Tax=Septoria linicola TaxID=215465 RepID=A0A9Q9EJC6_9PEZI|nr:hypothetical protein Slin14017_G077900 [Septoria linicola]USW52890.1 hypothetical protein Slin15195_G062090 [Septoria linicola]
MVSTTSSTTAEGKPGVTVNEQGKPTSFLDLPAEVRNSIYELAVGNDNKIKRVLQHTWRDRRLVDTFYIMRESALACTTRQIRKEVLPMLYHNNILRIDIAFWNETIKVLGPGRTKLVRRIKIETGVEAYKPHDVAHYLAQMDLLLHSDVLIKVPWRFVGWKTLEQARKTLSKQRCQF